MVVADDLVPSWRQDISDHHGQPISAVLYRNDSGNATICGIVESFSNGNIVHKAYQENTTWTNAIILWLEINCFVL